MLRILLRALGALGVLLGLIFGVLWLTSGGGEGELDYQISVKPTVMTVAYKAYGNAEAADGKYWLARVVLKNDGDGTLEDVAVSYRIPDFLDWTTPKTFPALLPGQTTVLPVYPKLPTKVTAIRSRTPTSIEFKITSADGKEKVESRPFEFRGVTEIEYTSLDANEVLTWYDMYANSELCAAFVTDEDPVVRQYMGKISETMGGFPIMSNSEEMLKVMKAIYNFQVATGMKYTGNKGVPEKLGDAFSMVQSVRLPRDVIYQNSGLCIELAMLWAALGQGAGAKAYLALVPGHCYPVLEAADGSMIAFESTGIGGSNVGGIAGFEDAVKAGNKQFQQLMSGQTPGVLVDVALHHQRGIRPPEFAATDIAGLAGMLEDRVKKARQSGGNSGGGADAGGGGGGQSVDGGGGGYAPPNPNGQWQQAVVLDGNFVVPYPATYTPNYQDLVQTQQFLPSLQFMATDLSGLLSVEVYVAPGQSAQDLMNQCQQIAGQFGSNFGFGQSSPIQIGGQQGKMIPFTVVSNYQSLQGAFYAVEIAEGTLGYAVSSPDGSWQQLGAAIAPNVRIK